MPEMGVGPLGWKDPLEYRGNGYPLQYSCLKNAVDRGPWQAAVQGGHKDSDVLVSVSVTDTHAAQWGKGVFP